MQCEAKPLSCGERTLAASVAKPLACAYSNQPTVNCGFVASALATIAEALSGMSTAKTPPKNRHAASHPATTASRVWAKVSHTNMCRENTAVKISACTARRRPAEGC